MGEATSMMRFLASKLGYYSSDPLVAYYSDMLIDTYQPLLGALGSPMFAPDEAAKAALIDKAFDEILPKHLAYVEPFAAKGKWLTGDKLQGCDFYWGGLYVNWFTNVNVGYGKGRWETLIEKFPAFKAFGERFRAENSKYLSTRRPCPF